MSAKKKAQAISGWRKKESGGRRNRRHQQQHLNRGVALGGIFAHAAPLSAAAARQNIFRRSEINIGGGSGVGDSQAKTTRGVNRARIIK